MNRPKTKFVPPIDRDPNNPNIPVFDSADSLNRCEGLVMMLSGTINLRTEANIDYEIYGVKGGNSQFMIIKGCWLLPDRKSSADMTANGEERPTLSLDTSMYTELMSLICRNLPHVNTLPKSDDDADAAPEQKRRIVPVAYERHPSNDGKCCFVPTNGQNATVLEQWVSEHKQGVYGDATIRLTVSYSGEVEPIIRANIKVQKFVQTELPGSYTNTIPSVEPLPMATAVPHVLPATPPEVNVHDYVRQPFHCNLHGTNTNKECEYAQSLEYHLASTAYRYHYKTMICDTESTFMFDMFKYLQGKPYIPPSGDVGGAQFTIPGNAHDNIIQYVINEGIDKAKVDQLSVWLYSQTSSNQENVKASADKFMQNFDKFLTVETNDWSLSPNQQVDHLKYLPNISVVPLVRVSKKSIMGTKWYGINVVDIIALYAIMYDGRVIYDGVWMSAMKYIHKEGLNIRRRLREKQQEH